MRWPGKIVAPEGRRFALRIEAGETLKCLAIDSVVSPLWMV